jgi:beta-lactamase superfamily II metal-dependent hydrolase
MIFRLEALQAHHGDSLLVHWGMESAPQVMLIDGGPAPTFSETLRTRLVDLAAGRSEGRLDIDLLMISHVDDDHIKGVQDLLNSIAKGRLPQVSVAKLWFNSFDHLIGLDDHFVPAGNQASLSVPSVRRRVGGDSRSVMASVPQGKKVAALAVQLGIDGNPPFRGLVMRPERSKRTVPIGQHLEMTVVGPDKARIDRLREEWVAAGAAARRPGPAALAELDRSVANLSSIVVLARVAGRSMLLTGDGRSDDILAGLRSARLLDRDGRLHVDLLKLPHHGSDRNVDTTFFRAVTADHYVISGDGEHNNPELATLAMLTEARGGARYTIHFTNRERRIEQWFARNKGRDDTYDVRYRRANDPSIAVDLVTTSGR